MTLSTEEHLALQKIKGKYWKNSFFVSLGVLLLWLVYYRVWSGMATFGLFVQALEATAATMIGFSFAFGTFTFYTDYLDKYLTYRKWFGLVGYWYLMVYFLILVLVESEEYFFKPLAGSYSPGFLFLSAILLYLSFMALIGHDLIIRELGPKLWRNLLRGGYFIYIFWIPRSMLLYSDSWTAWCRCTIGSHLPPPSLIFIGLSLAVILFRLSAFPFKWLQSTVTKLPPPGDIKKELLASPQASNESGENENSKRQY